MENKLDKNIIAKREYQDWQKGAKGFSEATVTSRMRSLGLYEEFSNNEDFSIFNIQKIIDFKEWLSKRKFNGNPISSNTRRLHLINVKKFFAWLQEKDGYKSKINKNTLEYLNPSREESAIAAAEHIIKFPNQKHILDLINSIKGQNEISIRDRGLLSFTYLTGMRDGAIISLPLKSINLNESYVIQDPRDGVNTKFTKTIYSKIFHFNEVLFKYFVEWYEYLKNKGFNPEDPLFPRSKNVLIENIYSFQESYEVESYFWKSTSSLRKIFKNRANIACLNYYPPHSFRHSSINSALGLLQNGLDLKAISQNYGHKDVLLVLSVYGQLSPNEQIRQLNEMEKNSKNNITNDNKINLASRLIQEIKDEIMNE